MQRIKRFGAGHSGMAFWFFQAFVICKLNSIQNLIILYCMKNNGCGYQQLVKKKPLYI